MSRLAHRPTHSPDGTPVQQSLTINPADYGPMNVGRLMKGVVLKVYPSDDPQNPAAQQKADRRGIAHVCDVLVVDDGTSASMTLPRVVIPPRGPSGIDNYEEHLPRGSSQLITGEEYNARLHQINPHDLDGDWVIVGFIGGMLDSPFILSYFPHAGNAFDPATSGQGLESNTLVQHGRYFKRTNGVEHIITSKGDVIISTTYANSALNPGEDPRLGRFARTKDDDVGGSVRVYIKPSQSVELTFNPQEDGIGIQDSANPELPQTNPQQTTPQASTDRPETFLLINKDRVESRVPVDHRFYSGERFVITSDESTEITVGTDFIVEVSGESALTSTGTVDLKSDAVLTIEGSQVLLGENAASPEAVLKGQALQTWLASMPILSPFGPLLPDPAYVQTLLAQVGSTKVFVE